MKRVLHYPRDREEIYHRFIAYVEEWKIRLILREWVIDVHMDTEGDKLGATAHCRPKYHAADIVVHFPEESEARWTDEEIEDEAIHELIHVLVSTWDAMWQRTHKKPPPTQVTNMLLIIEEQLCTRLAEGFMRTKYPRRKAHSSSPQSGGQGQAVPCAQQEPQ